MANKEVVAKELISVMTRSHTVKDAFSFTSFLFQT